MVDGRSDTRRAKKACTECRQQKARCDASVKIPCSRCQKVKAQCVISDPFKRENKRQKLNELEHEAQELRERLGLVDESRRSSHDVSSAECSTGTITSLSPMTLHRELAGQTLTASEVDELFNLYFNEFSQYLPVLDPLKTPDEYYESSTLLFWAVIGVGTRAYTRQPSLIHNLRAKIYDMAFEALQMSPTLETIRALLLIVTWPFPKSGGIWNPTFALLGAVLHSAMAIGLHIPTSSQEFLKHQSKLTAEDLRQRMVTWAYCVIVYQRTCICKGNPSLALSDVCHFPGAREMLYNRLDSTSCFQLRLHDTVTRALRAFSESGLPDIGLEQERSFATMINTYLKQLEDLHSQASLIVDELDYSGASLTLQIFHFYRATFVNDVAGILALFNTACQVLERFDKMSSATEAGLKSLSIHHVFALLNAAQALLRLFQTPSFAVYIDVTRAKAMVYLAVSLAKKMTVHPDDLAARAMKALSETAESKRAFKNPDGDGLPVPLRIRSRLAMSLILDGLMWWREEFGGTMGVFPVPLKNSSNNQQSSGVLGEMSTDVFLQPELAFDSFFSDQPWMGYEDLLSPSFLADGVGLDTTGIDTFVG